MDKTEMFDAVANHRLALCDQLEALTADQWDSPSLCDGWRIRDVVGHLVSLQVVPTRKFMTGIFGTWSFENSAHAIALSFGEKTPEELIAQYRSVATSRNAPPVIGPIAPLADVLVHSLDIQRPLGLAQLHTATSARAVLDALARGLPIFTSRKQFRDMRFAATDIEWTWGTGTAPVLRGTSSDLLLAMTGREGGVAALQP